MGTHANYSTNCVLGYFVLSISTSNIKKLSFDVSRFKLDLCKYLHLKSFYTLEEYFNSAKSLSFSSVLSYRNGKGKGHPANGRGGPRGSGQVKAQDFLEICHYEGGRLSAIHTGRLYPRRNP